MGVFPCDVKIVSTKKVLYKKALKYYTRLTRNFVLNFNIIYLARKIYKKVTAEGKGT